MLDSNENEMVINKIVRVIHNGLFPVVECQPVWYKHTEGTVNRHISVMIANWSEVPENLIDEHYGNKRN
jgi:hypothetical protein